MANKGMLPEGFSIHRPPYFNGTNFSYWKNRMQVFLRAQDYQVWMVVSKGPYQLSEDEDNWTEDEIKKSTTNFNAMNIMQCAIEPNEYSRISMCSSAKEMWDKLSLIYEGTSEVKETKANMLVQDYELFRMQPEESISEMFARLTQLTNGLKALGKEYTNTELVRKVLRSLPPAWHTKATVIEDSKNLTIMSLDELIGSLMTYEINMKRNSEEVKKKKPIALKATPVTPSSTDDDEDESEKDEEDKDLALFTRQMKKFLRRKRRFPGKYKQQFKKKYGNKGESSIKKNSPKKEPIMCYECKKPGHMRGECPELIKKLKKEKSRRPRAMMATWSDEDSTEQSSEELDELMESLCLMAHNDDQVNSEPEEISSEDWEIAYLALYDRYKSIRKENKLLRKKIEVLKANECLPEKCEELEKENEIMKNENEVLKNEKKVFEKHVCFSDELSKLRNENEQFMLQLSISEKQIENLKNENSIKSKINCDHASTSKNHSMKHKVTPPKASYQHKFSRFASELTCYYCQSNGHTSSTCWIRRNAQHLHLTWKPKRIVKKGANLYGPKETWVPKLKP